MAARRSLDSDAASVASVAGATVSAAAACSAAGVSCSLAGSVAGSGSPNGNEGCTTPPGSLASGLGSPSNLPRRRRAGFSASRAASAAASRAFSATNAAAEVSSCTVACVRGGRGDLAGMHHDDAAGARLNKLDHLEVGEAGHVVDDRGAAAHGRLGNRHMTRVNRDDGALFGQRAHHGQHAARFLIGIDRGKAGRVDSPPTSMMSAPGVEHRQAILDRGIRVEVLPAIAKRIGRHVEDAHDAPGGQS